MKRVTCFYRVSSKQQMINDDIPLQRNACLDYIKKHPDWQFESEYVEKGVSGFKVSASRREKLEELKEDALAGKFDVLLVFMFDRLGRIEEETPFVLKFFVDHGIEVWSVNEGQRKFDNHIDNLLNYITFWQAAGESKKTQIRTLEAKEQMIKESRYQGCSAPYGYKHISTGEHNKKGREIKKMVIDEEEAKVIKKMFNLASQKGYGVRRIAKVLNEEQVPTKRGGKWAGATVGSILKNSIYKGYFTYGRNKGSNTRKYKHQYDCQISDIKHDDLVIVSENQWDEVKTIIESRSKKNSQTHIPKQTKSPLLFTGYIYCKKCKSRMTLHYSYNHYKRKDGTYNKNKKPFYVCYGKDSGITNCDNKNYANTRIEGVVLKQVYQYLDTLEKMDIDAELQHKQEEQIKQSDKEIKNRKDKIKKLEDNIKLLKDEIVKVIMGTSRFSEELLMEQIDKLTLEANQQKEELEKYLTTIEKMKIERDDLISFKKSIPNYRDILENADIETKKMILPKFIDRIEVDQDSVDVTLNIKMKELKNFLSA